MNKRTTPQRVVERANIVLCSAEGRSGSAICREVGVSRPTVTQWLDRYEAGGVEELLEDRPRSGRPRKITPDDEAEIVRKTLEEKPADAEVPPVAVPLPMLDPEPSVVPGVGAS